MVLPAVPLHLDNGVPWPSGITQQPGGAEPRLPVVQGASCHTATQSSSWPGSIVTVVRTVICRASDTCHSSADDASSDHARMNDMARIGSPS